MLLDDEELAEIRELARRRHQTTAAWVREALRVARDTPSYPETGRKLHAVREAAAHAYPSGDIDDILHEIERSDVERARRVVPPRSGAHPPGVVPAIIAGERRGPAIHNAADQKPSAARMTGMSGRYEPVVSNAIAPAYTASVPPTG